ncbi:MAG TPA: IclR family transcriptional regulator [Casimicrobiaceae bacterium]|jgi:DNA-binding IclR family transcriptional regulator|nr:IclR family transcriptional regulator [Casimicrobiaceae bacterium]
MPFHAAEFPTGAAGSEQSDSVALRTFRALECVARAVEPPTLEELTRTLRLPKPTVFRILRLLSDAGLVQREMHRKRYVVGPRAAAFALDVQMQSPRRGEQRAILERLVETIGETCNLTMLDANEVLYVERVETTANIRLHMQAGSRVPLHCTASGKLLLSTLPPAQARRLLGPGPLRRFTSRTIVDPARLENELDAIRANDFSSDNAEYLVDSVCLAVPVRDPRGRVCAAIAVHGPSPRMTVRKGVAFVPAMREAAASLGGIWIHGASSASAGPALRLRNAKREGDARPIEA